PALRRLPLLRPRHHPRRPRLVGPGGGRGAGFHLGDPARLGRRLRSFRQPGDHARGRCGMSGLDPYKLDILASPPPALTEEIEITLLRSAYSQVVKEAQDASCAIFTAQGRIVAQPVVIPGHLGSMKYMLEACLKAHPASALAPGDVLITNDPYEGGS